MTSSARVNGGRLIACALWMGIAYGLIEGIGFSLLRFVPWVATPLNGTSPDILWIAPLEYAVAFGFVGLVFAAISRLRDNLRWDVPLIALLAGVAAFLIVDLQDHRLANYASAALAAGVAIQIARWYRRRADCLSAAMVRTLPYLAALVCLLMVATVGGARVLEAAAMRGVAPGRDPSRPNILLLVIDTERADHLSSYGYARTTTPSLDQLAREGVLFEQAHSASSWTLPSHASLMTGRWPHEHRAGDPFRPFLDNRYPTLAEVFRNAGYATGGFVSNTYWAGRQARLDRGFIRYEDHLRTFDDALFKPVLGRRFAWDLAPRFGLVNLPARQPAQQMNQHLLAWLDQIGPRPFFAFVNYMDVHGPFLAPPEYLAKYSHATGATATEFELAPTNDEDAGRMASKVRQTIDSYDGSLAYLDHEIGQLLDALRQRGLESNTLVIVTSDHGESFGEHGLINHGNSVYLDQTHVPLIMRFPGRLSPGVRSRGLVSLARLGDTILRLAGMSHPGFTGSPFIVDGGSDTAGHEQPVLTEVARRRYVPRSWPSSRGWTRALVTEQWHFILSESGRKELYNLATDAGELHNLADDASTKAVVAEFQADMERLVPPDGTSPSGARVAAGR